MGDKALKGNKLTKWLTNYAAPWDTDSRSEGPDDPDFKVSPIRVNKKMKHEAELKALLQGIKPQGTKKIKTTKRRAKGRK